LTGTRKKGIKETGNSIFIATKQKLGFSFSGKQSSRAVASKK